MSETFSIPNTSIVLRMPSNTINNLSAESSRKRHHHGDDEAAEERSYLNGESRKRVRLSDVRDETPAADPDDEAEYQAPASPDTPQKTQYELMRDNGFEHLRNEVADDQRATQRLRMRPNLLGENVVAENGIIEAVTCINFMCHERLHCDLGPLLNFIVGENGSGKSAILTAITLCLGGKASSTNRGGSLKAFVKEGRERALLIVQIKNQGVDAFKHDIYGDSIIVERHFSKSGSSGFKIKTATGAIHSTKKQEVDEIVEYYALQVDNPLNVLSQDNARQFLNASTKAQKYKFFIEGVQLQQLDNDYKLIAESLSQMEAKVPDQERRVGLAKAERAKAERLLESLEGERAMREKLNYIRLELAWAIVEKYEAELANREKLLADINAKIEQTEVVVTTKGQEFTAKDQRLDTLKANIETIKEEETALRVKLEEAQAKYEKFTQEVMQIHAEERDAYESFKTYSTQVTDFEQKIVDEEKKLQEANGGAQTEKLKERDEARAKVAETEKQIEENKSSKPRLTSQADDSSKALTRAKDEMTQKQKEVSSIEEEIKTIERSLGGPLDAYDRSIPALLKAIENESRFQDKPIGPIGTLVHLHKPEWAGILESYFGATLNGFLVYSKSDMNLLTALLKRFNLDNKGIPIFVAQRQPLNLAGKEPDDQFDTILRVLKIDNQAVRDLLVINHMIEQVLLIPKRKAAEVVMIDSAPPRNVKMCLAKHDTKNEGLNLKNNGNSNISTSPIRIHPKQPKRLKTETGSQIAFLKQSLAQRESEYKTLVVEYRRLQQENQRHKTELDNQKRQGDVFKNRLQQLLKEVDVIEAELDVWDGSDARLRSLQEQLEGAMKQKDHFGVQYGEMRLVKDEKNREASEAKKTLDTEKLQMKDFGARLKKAEEKLKQGEHLRHIALTEKNESITKLEGLLVEKQEAEASVARQRHRVDNEQLPQALEVCPERIHLPAGETKETLEKKYEVLHNRYKSIAKSRRMDEQQVHAHVEKARETHKRAVNALKSMVELNERLRQTLSQRLDKWRKFQRYISSQSRANFIYLLSERGFRGKLLLDHERRALDLQVEPDKTEKRANGRSTKTLSGGEKSFSSICLLLAIWEAMGSPLRCLDEFDVFMDNVNRAISTNMLITAARRSVNRQYIFITPNAIEGRNALEKDVKIIRLTDPRQRQITDM